MDQSETNNDQPAAPAARLLTRADGIALLTLAALFIALLIGSWQRWTQPLIDHGRELNLPARVLAGDRLYLDVQFLYGPLAPYLNALLYRLCGVQMATLQASGVVCALLILLMIYWLARRLMNVWEAVVTTALVLVICALKSTANYIHPYAYAALYGLVFALGSLVGTLAFVQWRRARALLWAGVCAGLALISKPEMALAALAAAYVALVVESLGARRLLWREALYFAAPVLFIGSVAYGLVLSRVPLAVLLNDNHVLFTNMPPQLVYFNRQISGIGFWPTSFWFSLTGLASFGGWAAASAALGALISARRHKGWRGLLKRSLLVLALFGGVYVVTTNFLGVPKNVTPFAGAVFVLPLVIGALGWRIWQARGAASELPFAARALLILAVFSLMAILRAFLNVTIGGPYTPFFIPVLIVVYMCLLFRFTPQLFAVTPALRRHARLAAVWLMALLAIGMGINSARRLQRSNTFLVSSPRGSFYTEPEWGVPMAAAIAYAKEKTKPDDYVLTLPQATMINFLAARRYPLREEIVHPGFLAEEKELDAIDRIKAHRVPLILVVNLLTPEFRDRSFGADYNQELMRWITENYRLTARFEYQPVRKPPPDREPFFILAYELINEASSAAGSSK